MAPFRWYLGFLKKYIWLIVVGLIMCTLYAGLTIVSPYLAGNIVDDVVLGGNYQMLTGLVIALIIVSLISGILRFFLQFVFELASQKTLYDMRRAIYRKLIHEDFAFFNKRRTGDIMSRQTGDMDAVRHFTAYVLYMIYQNVLIFLFALVMIIRANVTLALLLLSVLPFTAMITVIQSKKVKPQFARIRDCFSSLNAFVQENVSGNRVVKAFAKEAYEIEKFNAENDKYMDAQIAATDVWKRYLPSFEILAHLLTVILIIAGGYMVISKNLTLGELVRINGYLWMLNTPLRMAGWWVNDTQNAITSIEKIYDTYTEEPSIHNPKKIISTGKIQGLVEFRDVSFQAEDQHQGEDIVRNITFTAKVGETIGIIGTTGSGKSTLMNLLCRFIDATSGEILIDGVNVKDRDLYELRDSIGMAMQDVFLFSDTIEGNIAYGRPDCSFEDIKRCAIMADANHFIKHMPEGYDTMVGERGVGLSGGQKQRISLARALLKEPSILILDDTTSAVDMETESYIQKQLSSLPKDTTKFIIAYRISSIRDSDHILVMDKGEIIEQGTHDELVKGNGYYATAFRNQYGEIPTDLLEERVALRRTIQYG